MLNQELLKGLFNYDEISGGLFWRIKKAHRIKIGDRFGSVDSSNGYIKGGMTLIKYQHKTYYEHRLIWIYHGQSIPDGMEVDHINHNRTDNRIENLRIVTTLGNGRNKKRKKKNKTFGVAMLESGNWKAEINNISSGYIYLGTFKTETEAIVARKTAEKLYNYHENHGK